MYQYCKHVQITIAVKNVCDKPKDDKKCLPVWNVARNVANNKPLENMYYSVKNLKLLSMRMIRVVGLAWN
jgi:hypothetical protein